jgi:hypothetical protein
MLRYIVTIGDNMKTKTRTQAKKGKPFSSKKVTKEVLGPKILGPIPNDGTKVKVVEGGYQVIGSNAKATQDAKKIVDAIVIPPSVIAPTPTPSTSHVQASSQFATNENGTPTKLWCQFPCDEAYNLKVQNLKTTMGFKTLGHLAKFLFDQALTQAKLV